MNKDSSALYAHLRLRFHSNSFPPFLSFSTVSFSFIRSELSFFLSIQWQNGAFCWFSTTHDTRLGWHTVTHNAKRSARPRTEVRVISIPPKAATAAAQDDGNRRQGTSGRTDGWTDGGDEYLSLLFNQVPPLLIPRRRRLLLLLLLRMFIFLIKNKLN